MNDLVNVTTTVLTTKNVQMTISEHVLLKLLKLTAKDAKNVRVFVRIGGGGDYSNMDLDLNECQLIVQYETMDKEIKSETITID